MIASAAMKSWLAIMFGGAIGTGLRMWLSTILEARHGTAFPVATLVVNALGSFVIGLFAALTAPEGALAVPALARQVVMIGVLGGFTTFSAFSLQTLTLASGGEWQRAGWYIALSVLFCLAAVWIGHFLATLVNSR